MRQRSAHRKRTAPAAAANLRVHVVQTSMIMLCFGAPVRGTLMRGGVSGRRCCSMCQIGAVVHDIVNEPSRFVRPVSCRLLSRGSVRPPRPFCLLCFQSHHHQSLFTGIAFCTRFRKFNSRRSAHERAEEETNACKHRKFNRVCG